MALCHYYKQAFGNKGDNDVALNHRHFQNHAGQATCLPRLCSADAAEGLLSHFPQAGGQPATVGYILQVNNHTFSQISFVVFSILSTPKIKYSRKFIKSIEDQSQTERGRYYVKIQDLLDGV